jgi:RNA polymerase sigma-70 factor (ECF subfamily)
MTQLLITTEMSATIDNSPEQSNKVAEFELAVSPFYEQIKNACISKTRNFAKGEELAQEVIFKAFKSWDSFQDQGKGVMPWINAIIRNTNISVGVKESAHDQNRVNVYTNDEGDVDFGLDKGAHASAAEDVYFEQLSSELVRNAIEQLSVEYAEATMLSLVADWTYQEIADHLNIPVKTVGTKIFRGRALLRKLLTEQAQEYGIGLNQKNKKK